MTVGRLRVLDIGDPAAAAEYTVQTVGAALQWRLEGFNGTLVADANAANRHFRIEIDDGTNPHEGVGAEGVVTASQTAQHLGARGATRAQLGGILQVFALPETWFPAGSRVNFHTTAIQAGDDWGQGHLSVSEAAMGRKVA